MQKAIFIAWNVFESYEIRVAESEKIHILHSSDSFLVENCSNRWKTKHFRAIFQN